MAEKVETGAPLLKLFFNEALIKEIGDDIAGVYEGFDRSSFVSQAIKGLDDLELKARALQITAAMGSHLPPDFGEASKLLLASMGEPDDSGGLEGMGGFKYMPHVGFLSEYGLNTPEIALDVMGEMTKHFSCEFPIRFFLIDHPELAMSYVRRWAKDKDWRVRRLASEGTRPRLPWAQVLRDFVEDPSPVIDVLFGMHDDPELIVRRSVANNLNDIAKDHPDVAASTARYWSVDASEGSLWTVKHGLRTLVKQGHKEALAVLGYEGGEGVDVQGLELSNTEPKIGGESELTFSLHNPENKPVNMVVDYELKRQLAGGKTGTKVFKLKMLTLEPGASAELATKLRFKQLSTRTYYPGEHGIEILINGRRAGEVTFNLGA